MSETNVFMYVLLRQFEQPTQRTVVFGSTLGGECARSETPETEFEATRREGRDAGRNLGNVNLKTY